MHENQRLWKLWGRNPSAAVISGKDGNKIAILQGHHPQNYPVLAGMAIERLWGIGGGVEQGMRLVSGWRWTPNFHVAK
jgi:hypothetical protein